MDILLLCTANQCRSPMAEALLRRHLERAGAVVSISSAGLHPGDRPATAHGIAAMADRGLDLQAHRSRQLDAELIESADLVVAMAREHVREVAVIDAEALARTFTLKELVRLAAANGSRRAGEPLRDWLLRIGRGRRREDLIGVGYDDDYDIDDPVGKARADYESTADELDGLLGRLAELGWSVTTAAERTA